MATGDHTSGKLLTKQKSMAIDAAGLGWKIKETNKTWVFVFSRKRDYCVCCLADEAVSLVHL